MNPPSIGHKYKALSTDLIQRNRGIRPGSIWVVTCTLGDKISLSLYEGNPGGFHDLTILKEVFGTHFSPEPGALNPDAYRSATHARPTLVNRQSPIQPI